VVVRRRGARDVAIIAADELSSLTETAHLLRSPGFGKGRLTDFLQARLHYEQGRKQKQTTNRPSHYFRL
jgi:antitoxin YefM